MIVGLGFGASLSALFAQLGGGIYTKAADVGADIVGKIEKNIPEDDPRNPAVIADNVGDNVGDIAGRGADLFESMTGENIGAMLIGLGLFAATQNFYFVLFPLLARAVGIGATILGIPFVRIKRRGRSNERNEKWCHCNNNPFYNRFLFPDFLYIERCKSILCRNHWIIRIFDNCFDNRILHFKEIQTC